MPAKPALPNDSAKQTYRKESVHHMFMGSLYAAFGTASFFGVLNNLVGMAINGVAAPSATTATVSSFLETMGVNLSAGSVTAAVMVGLVGMGVLATYCAQQEWTELKCLQDEWLAKKNAECLGKSSPEVTPSKTVGQKQAIEHPDHQRSDNKSWQQATAESRQTILQIR